MDCGSSSKTSHIQRNDQNLAGRSWLKRNALALWRISLCRESKSIIARAIMATSKLCSGILEKMLGGSSAESTAKYLTGVGIGLKQTGLSDSSMSKIEKVFITINLFNTDVKRPSEIRYFYPWEFHPVSTMIVVPYSAPAQTLIDEWHGTFVLAPHPVQKRIIKTSLRKPSRHFFLLSP